MLLRKSSLFGGVTEAVDQRRNQREERWVLVTKKREELRCLKARHQHERASDREDRIQHNVQSVNVVQRQAVQRDIVLRVRGFFVRHQELEDIRDQVRVGEHYAFGESC